MNKSIKNFSKTPGIFKCRHPAHKLFKYQISPYHVLTLKKCYPQGCVEFLWRCRLFEKGQTCHRKIKHVGRGCFSCSHYIELKVSYSPEILTDAKSFGYFIDDYHEYQGWLESKHGRTVNISGKIDSVKPHLTLELSANRQMMDFDGFFISLTSGYINNDLFDDKLYLRISSSQLEKFKPAPGDSIESEAIFSHTKGRVILQRARKLNIERYGGYLDFNISKALVSRATGAIIRSDIIFCSGCQNCSLIDIKDSSRTASTSYRRFFCLRGIEDSENCPVRIEKLMPVEDN